VVRRPALLREVFVWRKPNDAKPSSQSPTSPLPSFGKPPELATSPAYAPAHAAPPVLPRAAETAGATLAAGASRLSAGLKIHGEISGSSDLFIDGEAQGKIKVSGARVTVGPNGRVQSDIEAREIFISGSVQGNLKAVEKVHVGSTGRVQGSVLSPRLGIEEGARFRGKVDMTRQAPSRESGTREVSNADKASELETLHPVPAATNGE
jgi:cytoskeletal protein CcmA (bactofilin family)